jgi:L-iditol 2-dehydrogenase
MTESMRCIIWQAPGRVELCRRPIPAPGEGEALVEILTNGICASDFPIVQGKVDGSIPGMVLGHEPVGRVLALGRGAARLQPGQRVALDTMLACRVCRFCKEGHPEWCTASREIGFTADGCYSDFAVFPEENLHVLPDEIDDIEGTMIEALTCQLGGVDALNIAFGDSVAILGSGLAALTFIQLARLKGAGSIAILMRSYYSERAALAREFGADQIVTGGGPAEMRLAPKVQAEDGFDVVIDAVGSQETTLWAIDLARRGGKVLPYGLAQNTIDQFPLGPMIFRNLTVYGRTSAPHAWEPAIELLKRRQLRLGAMAGEVIALEEVPAVLMGQRRGPKPLKRVARVRGQIEAL